MKTILLLTSLISSGILLLSGCRTAVGPGPERRNSGTVKATPRGQSNMPGSYYKRNAEGSYYYTTGAEAQTNSDYRPTVRRNAGR